MKKIICIGISFVLAFVLGISNVFALEENLYYVESGQIDLTTLNISKNENNDIIIEEKNRDINSNKETLNQLLENESIKEEFINMLEHDNLPDVYGYSRYELKEVNNEDGTVHLEPITVSEKYSRSVPTNEKYQLTLTLSVNSHDAGGLRYIGSTLTIHWDYPNGAIPEFRVERTKPDYVSMSYPSPYMIDTDADAGISGVADEPSLDDIEDYAVVGCFYESVGTTYMRASSVISAPSIQKRRFTARYVHTYGSKEPSYSISSDGVVSFNGTTTSNDMWGLSVYVDYSC